MFRTFVQRFQCDSVGLACDVSVISILFSKYKNNIAIHAETFIANIYHDEHNYDDDC